MKYALLGLLLSASVFARSNDLTHRPKSFTAANGKAVFADFTEATYNITYDGLNKTASVKASIRLNMVEAGNLVFDSVEAPVSIKLNGKAVTATETKTPSNETTVRVLDESVAVGVHMLEVEVPLKNLVEFTSTGVKSAFWTSDLSERQFLERYLPANFEFDQVKMHFVINFIGSKNQQVIYTNGQTARLKSDSFRISYPSYYTASSIFFHTVPQGTTEELRFTIRSVDGRELPSVVYVQKSMFSGPTALNNLKQKTMEYIAELEGDYGPFPHNHVIVYNAGMGGMEYCGATITEMRALGHELFHSYFARGVMPANGNSGWLDEALASWRDSGYKSEDVMSGSSRMSAHPYYTRTTDRAAYSFGERFMRMLDKKFADKGGLKPFMRMMVEKRAKAPIFVEEFIKEMSAFYGVDVMPEFRKYTYGTENLPKSLGAGHNPVHGRMSLADLKKIF